MDHPRTCKWLGSPPFISHVHGHLEGVPRCPTYDHHGYEPLTNWDDPPSSFFFFKGGVGVERMGGRISTRDLEVWNMGLPFLLGSGFPIGGDSDS